MFLSYQKSTGTQYARSVALVLTGSVASPAALFLSRPFGSTALFVALAFTTFCFVLAWDQWRRKSALTMLSIAPRPRSK